MHSYFYWRVKEWNGTHFIRSMDIIHTTYLCLLQIKLGIKKCYFLSCYLLNNPFMKDTSSKHHYFEDMAVHFIGS